MLLTEKSKQKHTVLSKNNTGDMFMKKSAWFSRSVPQKCYNFWVLEGGTIADWRTADYLFSEDAACPDTVRIFESQDYLWKNVTVFQSMFLSTCEKRQSVKSVCIGHYVLPPISVQDKVRNVVGRLIWECEDEPLITQGPGKSFSCQADSEYNEGKVSIDSSEDNAYLCGHFYDYPVDNIITGYVRMEKLQKYSGDLADFHPVYFQCSNCEAHAAANMHIVKRRFKRKK